VGDWWVTGIGWVVLVTLAGGELSESESEYSTRELANGAILGLLWKQTGSFGVTNSAGLDIGGGGRSLGFNDDADDGDDDEGNRAVELWNRGLL